MAGFINYGVAGRLNMKVAIVCAAGIVSGKEIVALERGEGLHAGRPLGHLGHEPVGQRRFQRAAEGHGTPVSPDAAGFHLSDADVGLPADDGGLAGAAE